MSTVSTPPSVGGPYFLRTERLGFRCWIPEDLPAACALWGDLEVTRYFGGPFSNEEVVQKLQREISRMKGYRFQYGPIFLLSNDEHVGCCGLRPYRMHDQVHELGFHLRLKYWGRGLAVEAAQAVIALSFETIAAKSLVAGHHPENVNSKKVLEKLGFRYSHDELFPALDIDIPYYLLAPPAATDGNTLPPSSAPGL
jgi:RimJ/RimL family protein N-acetyltransferase